MRLLCPGARSVAWPSTPSDLCLQRLDATSTDCVEKRDPRQDATNKYCQLKELDFNARLEKQSHDSTANWSLERPVHSAQRTFAQLLPKIPRNDFVPGLIAPALMLLDEITGASSHLVEDVLFGLPRAFQYFVAMIGCVEPVRGRHR